MNEITEKVFPKERTNILAYYPNIEIDAAAIKIVMINEIVADAPVNDFYSPEERSFYMETTIPLFQQAGIDIQTIEDIVTLGIYITNAVKRPKTETAISTNQVKEFLPLLKKELQLFPNLKAVMLNGDIAKKAFNMLSKQQTGKNAVPSMSTYKLRNREVYADQLRIFPAYIMTGKNVLIEKSKVQMTAEDIAKMIAYAQ
ncbi:uracil-DNA glycosylase [Enterococcus sp. BWM-S5]|uniref:Uracil-DNA glycosylase n=2 Tax=Enterococcus larvae TaxID=2794352 RepID=A0ABS4CGV0_9ENTE|nr:uracil-DNA glycosylase family protein [Enterococcus larvae]MBP1045771.1 uracil-DNA glycosylase [Enterococcus larvae]